MSQLIDMIEKALPSKKLDIFGKNSLLNSTIPYYLLALLSLSGLLFERPNPYPFIVIIYAIFPLLDEFFSLDERNPSNE